MERKNILITGGAGFIGSHLVDRLLAEGNWSVVVMDNFNNFYSPRIKFQNVSEHIYNKNLRLIGLDILDRETLDRVFDKVKFDTIVHLAAQAGVRPSIRQPKLYAETNIIGTLNLLELARLHGVKQFIFGSSSSVYGNSSRIPFNEDDPISKPISPYSATKASAEQMCHTYSHLYDLRCICLRFFTCYGARQRPDLAIHKFAALMMEDESIPVFGDGSTKRDYTYIEDTIDGIRAAIDYDETDFEIINLGRSEVVELRKLIEILEYELNKKAIIDMLPLQPGDVDETLADISKAKRLLGYDPNTKIEKGIRKFAEWFRNKEVQERQKVLSVSP
jgi:UDP-glucuronate 4-epimerase